MTKQRTQIARELDTMIDILDRDFDKLSLLEQLELHLRITVAQCELDEFDADAPPKYLS